MTDPAAAPARPGRARPVLPRRPRALPTALAALACFAVMFEFLAFQLGSGNDPAIGAGTAAEPAALKRPTVIDRKIVQTKVVSLPPKPTVTTAPAASSGSSPTTGVAPTAASAPAPAAPAAAPAPAAPAPTPAPAAPVTSTS
jgi:hypothetical protein